MHLPGCQFRKLPRHHGMDTFAVERRDAVWRSFDASFKGILTSGGDKTYSHGTDRRVAHFKSARASDKRSSLLPQVKKGETKFQ